MFYKYAARRSHNKLNSQGELNRTIPEYTQLRQGTFARVVTIGLRNPQVVHWISYIYVAMLKFLRWVNLPVWETAVSSSPPNIRKLVNLPVGPLLATRLINYSATSGWDIGTWGGAGRGNEIRDIGSRLLSRGPHVEGAVRPRWIINGSACNVKTIIFRCLYNRHFFEFD